MPLLLYDPMHYGNPRACVAAAFENAMGGGQSLLVRALGSVRLGHLIDGDVLRLHLAAKAYTDGNYRFIPQAGGIFRVDLLGVAFERALADANPAKEDEL